MTALAVQAKLPEMPIILLVAGRALLRHPDRARRIAVASRTLQLGVRAEQREMCFPGMIEAPQRPAVCRMAAFALVAEATLVHVIAGMAADATAAGTRECQRRMALGTAHYAMQAQ